MLYCRDCGKENPDDAKFCCNCGALLTLQPTQGTGLRSLPEIKPDTVEEIEDFPDATGIVAIQKDEIKLELPEKPDVHLEEEPVELQAEPAKEEAGSEKEKPEEITELKTETIEDKIASYEEKHPEEEKTESPEPHPEAKEKKKFPWLAVCAGILLILLIVFLIIKFKK